MSITCIDIPRLVLSGNEILLKIATSSDSANYTNHTLTCIITINSVNYSASLPVIDAGSSRYAIFDISFALKQSEQYNNAVPSGLNSVYLNVGSIKYSVSATERYFDTSTGSWYTSASATSLLSNYYAFDGGLPNAMVNLLKSRSTSFYEYFVEARRFLTNLPNNAIVSKNQPISLYFASEYTISDRNIVFTIRTASAETEYIVHFDSDNYTMNQILITPETIAGDAGVYDDIVSITIDYKIGFESGNPRTYYIEGESNTNRKYITFKNSFGAYDCLEILGEEIVNVSTNKETIATRTVDKNTGMFTFKQLKGAYKKSVSNDLSYIEASDIIYLTDLINSEDVYILYDLVLAHSVEKVILENNDLSLKNDVEFDNLYNFPISYYPAAEEKYFIANEILIKIQPPYVRDLDALFLYKEFDYIKSELTTGKIQIYTDPTYGKMILFPITLSPFNFSNTTYWKIATISLPWYNALLPTVCPLSFLSEANFTSYATTLTINSVFLNTYTAGTDERQLLPIIVYNSSKAGNSRFYALMAFYLSLMSSL